MKRIIFICQWDKKRNKTWSGTCWSIYKGLSNFFDVLDLNIKVPLWFRIKLFIYKYVDFAKYDFQYRAIQTMGKSIWKKGIKEEICSLQFAESPLSDNIHGYIYQDMNVKYIDDVILKDETLKKYYKKRWSNRYLKLRLKNQQEFYEKCNGIFVMGEWLRQYMISEMNISPRKVHCVGAGYGIDVEKCDVSGRTSNKILFVGRDFERKGGKLLLQAFSILKRKYQKDAELYIAGPREVRSCNNLSGIHFLDALSSDKLIDYYGLCDIFCMPSYLEPYGKVYIEALCCAMPVIARDSFAARDFIEDGKNGILINEDDPEKLALDMYDLLHNEKIKAYVRQQAKKNQEIYSWDAVAKRMYDVMIQDDFLKE